MIISRGVALLLGLATITAHPPAADAAPRHQAVQVSVERTHSRQNLSIFQVSGGIREAGVVLRMASSPAFRGLRSRYVPTDRSGRYRYEVTVTYRHGGPKRIVTYSNTPGAPRLLFDVIHRVETFPTPVFPPGFPFD
ncbi:hypothetical protein Q0Z83_108910 [Actinoplanes sichuanensis]|uniref:Uncharacterized protein n=1 Tax=Actinoplanes sichuanensis TaxID=512349 RepID=A0ABW4ADE6_9ACTN|nr:hypothetical protein [Actinoplanes sichuanensis]BEL12700.1 hypothetical protein Q0Z83_108910 [Actinoplanes sichuanensis]